MEGEQFSLCWNNFHSNLSSGFHSLLTSEDLVDVTLAAEGKYIKAHKTVLSVCSPYFKELFRVNPCKHPIVILQDVNYEALRSILQFMYKGEVSVGQEEIPVFMKVAELLQIKGLTNNYNDANCNGNDKGSYIHNSISTSNKGPLMRASFLKRPKQTSATPPPSLQKRPKTSFPSRPKAASVGNVPVKPIKIAPVPQKRQPGISPALLTMPVIAPMENVTVKQEAEDTDDDRNFDDSMFSEEMDISSMLQTSLGEGTDATWSQETKSGDLSSPGTVQCMLSKRGIPRLIIDGHVFFKKNAYKNKTFWNCRQNRTRYKCQAVCCTMDGQIAKLPQHHTHNIIVEPGDDGWNNAPIP